MQIIDSEQVVTFDVDDTLVMWGMPTDSNSIGFKDPYDLSVNFLKPHKKHIALLKKYKGRGLKVIVWSAAGFRWAETVVKTLGLEDYVDYIMTKPAKVVDDLTPNEFLPCRIYLEDK